MPQKSPRSSYVFPSGPRRPGQDIITAKNATQFPGVGMTLGSYSYRPDARRRASKLNEKPSKGGRWQRVRKKITLKRVVLSLAAIVLLIGLWVGGKLIYNAHRLFGGNIFGLLSTTKLKGEDEGRVNILLAGNSADDPGHGGAQLTDSIMVVSIDTKNNKAFLLSIPRDLWVHVPGDGHEKINNAYVYGEQNDFRADGYPNGGMGQLEQIVSRNLDIPIHYYALVDYSAFKQSVDAVGGVDIVVKSDDPRGLYDPNTDYTTHGPLVKLSNGPHHLNGQQALDLARARGDSYRSYGFAGSDFTRTEHQRQLLVALKSKAVTAGVLANPAKLTNLSDAIGNNVKTDFKLSEVRRLYDISKKIDNSQVKSLSLNNADGKNLLTSYNAFGQSALIPAAGIDDFSDIQHFVRRQTSSNPVVQESAKVVVLNGTSINGLAAKTKSKLSAKQIDVDSVGDAGNSGQQTTAVIDLSKGKKPATAAALGGIFGNHLTTQNPYGSLYNADFIVIVGQDQVGQS